MDHHARTKTLVYVTLASRMTLHQLGLTTHLCRCQGDARVQVERIRHWATLPAEHVLHTRQARSTSPFSVGEHFHPGLVASRKYPWRTGGRLRSDICSLPGGLYDIPLRQAQPCAHPQDLGIQRRVAALEVLHLAPRDAQLQRVQGVVPCALGRHLR